MYTKLISAAAVVLASSSMVSAQTTTACDPTKKTCPNDPAFAGSFDVDLTKGASDLFTNLAGTKVTYDGSTGGVFTINTENDAPTMQSGKYMFFGRVDVTMQAAPGAGIVSSFVLQSDDLDEIDIEFVGGDNANFQSNYFSKGDTTTYDRGAYHPVANPTGQMHTYSLIWTQDSLQWLLDGATVRTLTYQDAKGGSTYPQTPMQIKFGTWVAGRKGAPEGTATWAGGYTNFANAPFIGYYKEIKITDNAGGVAGAKQYIWSDHSGTWQSIKVDTTGDGSSNTTDSSTASSTPTASQTQTQSSSQTTMSTVTTTGTASSSGVATAPPPFGSTSGSPTGSPTTSASGAASTTAAPNAAGKTGLTIANAAVAGLVLVAANFFLL